MSLGCRLRTRVDGSIAVTNPDGTPSQLYAEALAFTEGNQEEAFNIWKTAYSDDFLKESFYNINDEASLSDVLTYLDTHTSTDKRLSNQDKASIKDIMDKHSIGSLSKLYNKLSKILKSTGSLGINNAEAIRSGLYTAEDLRDIDLDVVGETLEKIEGELSKEDMMIEPTEMKPAEHINSNFKTILGTSERVTESDIIDELLDSVVDFSDSNSIIEAVNNLPYENFVNRFNTNKSFQNKLISQLNEFKRVPIYTVVGEELVDKNLETYTTVKNTILDGIDTKSIRADIDFLQGISEEVWNRNSDQVSKVLKEIESELADINIDVIGLSNQPGRRSDVIDLLDATEAMLLNINKQNIENFAKQKDILIPPTKKGKVLRVGSNMKDLSLVRVESPLDAGALYDKFGLLKIGENLYQKVKKGQKSEMYEYIYQRVLDGKMEVETEVDVTKPANKIQVLKDIEKMVMSRDTGIYSKLNHEEISLNQLIWNHPKIVPAKIKYLDRIKTSATYLKTKFISDFYKYTLQEKEKNSFVYRNILSKFNISDTDINLIGRLDSIEGIKYEEELKDYILLKRDSEMNYLVEERDENSSEDATIINNPRLVSPYTRPYSITNNTLVTNRNFDNYVRVGEDLFRKVLDRNDVSAYTKLTTESGIYYSIPTEVKYNAEEVDKAISESGFVRQTVERETPDEVVNYSESNLKNLYHKFESTANSNLKSFKLYTQEEEATVNDRTEACG